ncbi:hypothetical protein TSUD_272880 [Trifolium subterraneum]|uniref:PB1-like domain-containing protein n=1 Tax=Trifolium subterraneum TaxID=3900 RepID=A0A2Z6PT91_TRISU|nr:hypothetical protein TSUD_272880 [Trifolium subterraneum]
MVRDYLNVCFHHGGRFVDDKGTYVGAVENKVCDSDVWGYFEIVDNVTKLGYINIGEIWYDFAGKLKPLNDDFDAIEVANWARTNGKVDIYVVHTITQPDFVDFANVDEAQPAFIDSANLDEAQPEPVDFDNEAQLESEDSALDVEVDLDEVGLNDTGGVDSEVDHDVQGGAGSKKQKNKGGRPKKIVDEAHSKKRKGRPNKNTAVEDDPEATFSDEEGNDEETLETLNLRKKGKTAVEINEDYNSEEFNKNTAVEDDPEATFSDEEGNDEETLETLNLRKKGKTAVEINEDYNSEELESDVGSDRDSDKESSSLTHQVQSS